MKKLSIAGGVCFILLGISVFIWRTTLLGDFYDTGMARFLSTMLGFGLIGGGALMIMGGTNKSPREK